MDAPPPLAWLGSQGSSTSEVFHSLRTQPKADFSNPIWKTLPAGVVDLLNRLLEKDPKKRITCADVLKCVRLRTSISLHIARRDVHRIVLSNQSGYGGGARSHALPPSQTLPSPPFAPPLSCLAGTR